MQQEPFILPEKMIVRDSNGNGYVIEAVLGKGKYGAVYLVRDRVSTHNVFALKEVINPDKNARARFVFEGEVLMRLKHKALPRVYSVFENERLKRGYLLMDYIHGRNLEVLRTEQPGECFTFPVVRALMAPILDALKYLHSQDPPIVHRDIKPENIIVPLRGGEAVLADFGSAKEYVPGTATTMVGHRSPGYAALEQYRTGTSPSTDIYGLAATLYTLLTGITPIDALSRLFGSVSEGVDPLKPANMIQQTVPRPVAEALQRAMSLKSADRFTTVEQFWQALTAPDTQSTPRTTVIDLYRSSSSQHVSEENDIEPRQKKPLAPAVTTRVAAILLGSGAIGAAFFSYLGGFPILLFGCLVVLFLALAMLARDFYVRAVRPGRSKNLYER